MRMAMKPQCKVALVTLLGAWQRAVHEKSKPWPFGIWTIFIHIHNIKWTISMRMTSQRAELFS